MTHEKFKKAVELLHECYIALQLAENNNEALGKNYISLKNKIDEYFNNFLEDKDERQYNQKEESSTTGGIW